jgi:hypothetical protein
VATYVRSATQSWFGRIALNCRVTRSAGRIAAVSAIVVTLKLRPRTVTASRAPVAATPCQPRDPYPTAEAINRRKSRPPLARLREYFGADTQAVDITAAKVTRYIEQRLGQGAKPQTVKNEVTVLGRAFTLARKAGHLPQRPELPTIQVPEYAEWFLRGSGIPGHRPAPAEPPSPRGRVRVPDGVAS